MRRNSLAGLPLAGVDGTLSRRLKGSAGRRPVRALKTGTLRDAVGLAGYPAMDARGRRWVVVALVNHEGAPSQSAVARCSTP